jgi:FtsZ-interacting cell division protein YlmF
MDFFGLKDGLTNIANNDIMEQEKSQSKIISINRNNKKNKFKVIFHNPSSFAEVEKIVDDLKNSKAVILNL